MMYITPSSSVINQKQFKKICKRNIDIKRRLEMPNEVAKIF